MITTFSVKIYNDSIDAVTGVLNTTWVGMGPRVKELEGKLGERLGISYPVATSSGTASLEMALSVLHIGGNNGGSYDDEVITTPITFIATNSSILRAGARAVFADVDRYCNINPSTIESLITSRTRAIMCVHMYGHMCDMDRINDIGRRYNIPIVEDCAHAFDATYNGMKVGSEDNNIHCYSFQSVKNLTTIEGGMISLPNDIMYKDAVDTRWFGIDRSSPERVRDGTYNIPLVGGKFNMVDVNASIGLGQLLHIDEDNSRRIMMRDLYDDLLDDSVVRLAGVDDEGHALHAYTVLFSSNEVRERVIDTLRSNEVQTMILYRPHTYYDQFPKLPSDTMCEYMYRHMLTLPFHMNLSDDDIVKICELINEVLG